MRQGDPNKLKLDDVLHTDWMELKQALRGELRALQTWLARQPDAAFDGVLAYINTRGEPFRTQAAEVLTHLFLHLQHRRGQVSVAATRLGAASPEMDYIFWRRAKDAGTA